MSTITATTDTKLRSLFQRRFVRYAISGGIATAVDWCAFYILAIKAELNYQASLVIAFALGTFANYVLNKVFTFQCKSRQIGGQMSVHATVSVVSLLLSMLIIYLLVTVAGVPKMPGRIATTVVMLFVNYLMHKNTTFNERFFK